MYAMVSRDSGIECMRGRIRLGRDGAHEVHMHGVGPAYLVMSIEEARGVRAELDRLLTAFDQAGAAPAPAPLAAVPATTDEDVT